MLVYLPCNCIFKLVFYFIFLGMMVSRNTMRENLGIGMKYSIENGECIEKEYINGVEEWLMVGLGNEWSLRFRSECLLIEYYSIHSMKMKTHRSLVLYH